jgi:hypothetical protein
MLRFIIKRMVVRNQEAKDALETYLKKFDITAFPGENVPIACLRLKAVARALGNDDLPKNIVRTILEGFSKSSTDTFNDVCKSKIAMRSDSMYRTLLKNSSLHNQLIETLNDLENKYQELIGGKKWAGVGHNGLLQGSLFKISTEDPEQEMLDARAYAALKKIPFEEWCKNYATCHHCGKKGHIRPDCDLFKADVAAGKIKLKSGQRRDNRARHRGVREDNAGRKPPIHKNFSKDPKAKALVSAFAAFFAGNKEEDDEQDVESPKDEEDEDELTEDQLAFLSMVGSLKE